MSELFFENVRAFTVIRDRSNSNPIIGFKGSIKALGILEVRSAYPLIWQINN